MAGPGILKTYSGVWSMAFQVFDLLIVGLSGFAAGWFYVPPHEFNSINYLQLMIIAVLFSGLIFNRFGVYETWRVRSLFGEVKRIAATWTIAAMALSVLVFLTKSGTDYSRVWGVLWFVLCLFGLVLLRIVIRLILRQLRRQGFNQRQVVLVGYPDLTAALARRFETSAWLGLRVRDCIDVNGMSISALVATAESGDIDQIWITLPLREEKQLKELTDALALAPIEIKYVPDFFGLRLFSHSLSEVAGLPVVNLCTSPMHGLNQLIKAIEDRLLSAVFLVFLAPLMVLISIGVKLSSPGPVFFKQVRMGWGGKRINVLKFRSMVVHAEEGGAVTQASKHDARVTSFGAFLRRTSLDELPQFINVLLGGMSIVGPRPHAMAHNEQYKNLVDDYMHRHRVKPGITGWAQVNGFRGETDTLDKMERRVEYDLYYIENWSLWFDLKIIVMTIFKGFLDKNAY